jgi:glycosyltransferase involved in cell wall biosynthesis
MRNLDVIIPVKNEEKNVPEIVKQVHSALQSHKITHQIIIIVDKSKDKTLEVAHEMAKNYPVAVYEKAGTPGKGYSVLEGIALADADYIGFIDGDLQYPPATLPQN